MMHQKTLTLALLALALMSSMAFQNITSDYSDFYKKSVTAFESENRELIGLINKEGLTTENTELINTQIETVRLKLKAIDFWVRYLQPVAYKKINGPLPVEWETEVFEKFEKPYRREGAGLTLAELYLAEPQPNKDTLIQLLLQSDEAIKVFQADSITGFLSNPDHFFFANRLFLLNLAAVYTTGFECPDPKNVIIELNSMLGDVEEIYKAFNKSFPAVALTGDYLQLFGEMKTFTAAQNKDYKLFDHYHFIRDYVNPLYAINQHFIIDYHAVSKSFNDYSLNNSNNSIFNKDLYTAQNAKGIFISVDDSIKLAAIAEIGKLLFFDPILSGNGRRSCAGCHKPSECFTDTSVATSLQFDGIHRLARNTPSLTNAIYNHLLMQDGQHLTLLSQGKEVIVNEKEMGSDPELVLTNVMSCQVYRKAFNKFTKLTPNYPEVTMDHLVSALSLYYAGFSEFSSPFDRAMNRKEDISEESVRGFNLFMSKAQCGTCHFVPQFNGVKPPYIGSEFEVIGIPSGTDFTTLSDDSGRYKINSAFETMHAFRTGSIRNAGFTKPYMHNGIFKTMAEVINFYDAGGGSGKGLSVENQTLSRDSLHLTQEEKTAIAAFIKTLEEDMVVPNIQEGLPFSSLVQYKSRKVGGEY